MAAILDMHSSLALINPAYKQTSRPTSLVQQIESTTKLPITIRTSLTTSALSKCNQQSRSPLFRLPAELRELIFSFATTPHCDPCKSIQIELEYSYYPDHRAQWLASTALLLTCRRFWLEANHLPMKQGHHCFFLPEFWSGKGPSIWKLEGGCTLQASLLYKIYSGV